MSLLKLMKLLYIAHGFKLATKSQPLFTDTIEAWKYGPVVPSLYHYIRKHYKGSATVSNIPGVGKEDIDSLTQSDKDIIAKIFDMHQGLSAAQLVNITHSKNSPWHAIYDNIDDINDVTIYDGDTKEYYERLIKSDGKNDKQ